LLTLKIKREGDALLSEMMGNPAILMEILPLFLRKAHGISRFPDIQVDSNLKKSAILSLRRNSIASPRESPDFALPLPSWP
jgi:hypothetical protein